MYYFLTFLGLFSIGITVYQFKLHAKAKRNPFMPDSKQICDNILKNILAARTYADLVNCHAWVLKNEFVLSPGQRINLLDEISKKEQQLEDGLSEIMGHPIGKLQ